MNQTDPLARNKRGVGFIDGDITLPFQTSVMKKLGMVPAFIVTALKELMHTDGVEIEGKVWVRASSKYLLEIVGAFTEDTIQKNLNKLNRMGIVKSTAWHNDNPSDRTKWHWLDVDKVIELCSSGAAPHSDPKPEPIPLLDRNDLKINPLLDRNDLKDSCIDLDSIVPSESNANTIVTESAAQDSVSDKRKPKKVKAPKSQIPADRYFAVDHSLKAIHLWEFQTEQEGKDKLAQANKPACFEILSTGACENLHNTGYTLVHHRKRALVFDVILTHPKGFAYPPTRANETAPEVDKSVGGRIARIVKVYADRKGMTVNEVNASQECASEVKSFMDAFSESGLWGDIRDAVKFITRYNEWINNGKRLISQKKIEDAHKPYSRYNSGPTLDSFLNNAESYEKTIAEPEFGG